MLALDGYCIIVVLDMPALACRAALKPVSCINLYARLCGEDFQDTSAFRRIELGCRLDLARGVAVDHEAVVIALAVVQCREIGLDFSPEGLAGNEVHRGACHRLGCSDRDEGVICREIFRGIEFENVVQDGAGAFSIEIEIGVVGEVHNGRGVSLGRECEGEFILLRPLIMGHGLEIARIAGLSVLREIEKFHCIALYPAVPYLVLEPFRSAVEMVAGIVYREAVFIAVQNEMAFGNAVGISSRAFSRARAVCEIGHRIVIADNDIGEIAVLVRNDY